MGEQEEKALLTILAGGVACGFTDVLVDKLLLYIVKDPEKLRVIGEVFATDVINAIIYGGLAIYGMTKEDALTLYLGAGGLACQLGEEIIDHLTKI